LEKELKKKHRDMLQDKAQVEEQLKQEKKQ